MITKTAFETEVSYNKRKWFVESYLKYSPKTKIEEAERLSKIWINMIHLGCRYPQPIENTIHVFVKNNKKS